MWRSKAAVSNPNPEIHSVNKLNIIFILVGYGKHHRTIIIHKQQGQKGEGKPCEILLGHL